MNSYSRDTRIRAANAAKDKALKYGAWLAPALFSVPPALVLFTLSLFASGATTAMFVFFSLIALIAGFFLGLIITGGTLFYRARWLADVRERLAVDGIKANEVDWFMHELKTLKRNRSKKSSEKIYYWRMLTAIRSPRG
jgi:hypothetical protein